MLADGYIYSIDITYKTGGKGENTETYFAIRNASNLKFNFQDVQTNQIKITGDGTFTISFQPRISLR